MQFERERLLTAGLVVLCAVQVPLVWAWSSRVRVLGADRSLVLYAAVFVFGAVRVGGDIFALPYLTHRLGAQYVPAYYVGSFVSGALLSTLRIVQGKPWLKLFYESKREKAVLRVE